MRRRQLLLRANCKSLQVGQFQSPHVHAMHASNRYRTTTKGKARLPAWTGLLLVAGHCAPVTPMQRRSYMLINGLHSSLQEFSNQRRSSLRFLSGSGLLAERMHSASHACQHPPWIPPTLPTPDLGKKSLLLANLDTCVMHMQLEGPRSHSLDPCHHMTHFARAVSNRIVR